MKVIKQILKLIGILIIPYLVQILAFIGFGIVKGVSAVLKGGNEEIMTQNILNDLAEVTPLILLISSLIVIFIFYIVHTGKNTPSMKEAYRFNAFENGHLPYTLGLGLLVFCFSIACSGLFDLASLDPETAESLSALVVNDSALLTILTVGIVVPISEEIVFRGSVMKNLSKNIPMVWVIIIQAVIFSVYHFNLVQAFPTLVIGLVMGFAVYFTGSIYAGILIHMINNSIAVILSYVMPEDFYLSSGMNITIIIISGSLLLYIIKKLHASRVQFQPISE